MDIHRFWNCKKKTDKLSDLKWHSVFFLLTWLTPCSLSSFLYVHVEGIIPAAFMLLKPYQLSFFFPLFLLNARAFSLVLLQGMLPPTLGQASSFSFISQLKTSPPLRSLSIYTPSQKYPSHPVVLSHIILFSSSEVLMHVSLPVRTHQGQGPWSLSLLTAS